MSKVNEPAAQYHSSPQKKVTLEAYLEMIADGTRRLEYHDGVVVDIKSATEAHGLIIMNLSIFLGTCLLEKDCKLFSQDREIWVSTCRKVYYPDLIMVCGEHRKKQMSKNVAATINPSVVIEVLSDSTEKYDTTKKSKCYKSLSSLKQIVLVRQDEKFVTIQELSEAINDWVIHEYSEDEDELKIGDCTLTLKDIYRRVELFENAEQKSDDINS